MADHFEPAMPDFVRNLVPEGFVWPAPSTARQEQALAAARLAPVIPGIRNEFGDVIAKPNPKAVFRDEWSFATSNANEVRQSFPAGLTDLILLAPRHKPGDKFPPRYVYDGKRIWPLPIVQRVPGAQPLVASAQSASAKVHVHIDPSIAALAADVRAAVQLRDRSADEHQQAQGRHAKAEADNAASVGLAARRAAIAERRERELGSAYKDGREAAVGAFDDALAKLDAQIASSSNNGTAAARALPELARVLAVKKQRLDEAERRVRRAQAEWAHARQKGSRLALQKALDHLSPALAEIAALDEVLERGEIGHLTKASFLIDQLGHIFYREHMKEYRPGWVGHKGSLLPEFDAACASIQAELEAAGRSEELAI